MYFVTLALLKLDSEACVERTLPPTVCIAAMHALQSKALPLGRGRAAHIYAIVALLMSSMKMEKVRRTQA